MNDTYFTRKRGQAPEISADEYEPLIAMTDAEIVAGTESAPDNPPIDEARPRRMLVGRAVRRIREAVGLTQAQFAAEFRLGLGRLRDWEQAQFAPDFPAMAYLTLIADHPDIARALVEKLDREHLAA